jgi:hypothetical protein
MVDVQTGQNALSSYLTLPRVEEHSIHAAIPFRVSSIPMAPLRAWPGVYKVTSMKAS